MELVIRLDNWFIERLKHLKCSADAQAYVAGMLAAFKTNNMLNNESIVLTYYSAQQRSDFATYQRVGDWVLWVNTMHPSHLSKNKEIVESIGRLSYYTCHRILKGKWLLYEELADNFTVIVQDIQNKLAFVAPKE